MSEDGTALKNFRDDKTPYETWKNNSGHWKDLVSKKESKETVVFMLEVDGHY